MNDMPQSPKPYWVKLTIAAVWVSLLAPVLLSFVLSREYQFWQMLALLVASGWLFVCGMFTARDPVPVARWFGRPRDYEFLLRDRDSAGTRWYFRVAGAVMMLIALVLGVASAVMLSGTGVALGQRARP